MAISGTEHRICSIANLTRRNGGEFSPLVASIPVLVNRQSTPPEERRCILTDGKTGQVFGKLLKELVVLEPQKNVKF